jgi:hypothetical protein
MPRSIRKAMVHVPFGWKYGKHTKEKRICPLGSLSRRSDEDALCDSAIVACPVGNLCQCSVEKHPRSGAFVIPLVSIRHN